MRQKRRTAEERWIYNHVIVGSEKWNTYRRELLDYFDRTCYRCGENGWIFHHHTYEHGIFPEIGKLHWDGKPICQVLCAECHRIVHSLDRIPDWSELKMRFDAL